jgi:hypothetical protein
MIRTSWRGSCNGPRRGGILVGCGAPVIRVRLLAADVGELRATTAALLAQAEARTNGTKVTA